MNSTVIDSDRKLGNCSGDMSCCLKQQIRHRNQSTAFGIPSCFLLTSSLSGSSCSGQPPGGNHASACAFLAPHSMEPHAPFFAISDTKDIMLEMTWFGKNSIEAHRLPWAVPHPCSQQHVTTVCKHSMMLIHITPRQQSAQLCFLDVPADSQLCFCRQRSSA